VNHARSALLLAGHAASRALLGRRGLALVLLALLPAGVAWLRVAHDSPVGVAEYPTVMLMLVYQFVAPFAALFLGVAVLGDEIEGRTVTYLFSRPVPRPLVYVARYAGQVATFSVLLAAALALMALVFRTRVPIDSGDAALSACVAVLGFAVYAAFFAALRVFLRRALFVGFLLAFILEGFISKLPRSGVSSWSVWHHMAVLETGIFGRGFDTSGALTRGVGDDETVVRSLVILGAVLLASLAAGAWAVRARETRLANTAS
jgi:ABC-type transport system involved in multi-copper enzyme maturation permease subunit